MSTTIADRPQKAKPVLTAERARELFDYDPETGVLVWRADRGSRARKGTEAGSLGSNGYVSIRADRRLYLAHRLIWLHRHGAWPVRDLDHINGDRRDNRLSNLRSVSRSENQENQKKAQKGNRSGLLGVWRTGKTTRYRAQITVQGQPRHLGYFPTPEEAHAAYLVAKRRLHAGCTI